MPEIPEYQKRREDPSRFASYLDFVGSQVEELEIAEALERLDGNRVEEVEREVQLHQVGQL